MEPEVLRIAEVFPSLQSEGPLVGTPAIFVRFAGCNLNCDFCDTDFEPNEDMTVDDIMARIEALRIEHGKGIRLVVITGGEPFAQNLLPLIDALATARCLIQIETNGTIWQDLPYWCIKMVVSPKAGHEIDWRIKAYAYAFKVVVRAGDVVKAMPTGEMFIQPMDEGNNELNRKNNQWAFKLCLANNWRLSTQIHKFLGFA